VIDLRSYFPSASDGVNILRSANGAANAKYTFMPNPTGYQGLYDLLYDQNKDGSIYVWRKEYWHSTQWIKATDALLFFGDDKGVTEVGDWLPVTGGGRAFGYKKSGSPTGLVWSPANGLGSGPYTNEMDIFDQAASGAAYSDKGYDAYSRVGLIEHLDTYTPPFGRNSEGVWGEGNSKEYSDVVHLVMYHGTRSSSMLPVRCEAPTIAAAGAYYQSYKDYNSYAIELWLAAGKGIIAECTPFIEDAAYWGGSIPNCSGSLFNSAGFAKYIDETAA
jgi:hypothetical protein